MAAGATPQVLVAFEVGGTFLALPSDTVREVVLMPALSRPPATPSLIEGFMDFEGVMVPVLRLDRLLGLERNRPEIYTPVIVLRDTTPPLSLMARRMVGVQYVEPGTLRDVAPEEAFNNCVCAEITLEGGETAHVLSLRNLLVTRERQRLSEFQAMEQQRRSSLEAAAD